jgi:hypothetical protein
MAGQLADEGARLGRVRAVVGTVVDEEVQAVADGRWQHGHT